jgi:hypothetical protein
MMPEVYRVETKKTMLMALRDAIQNGQLVSLDLLL